MEVGTTTISTAPNLAPIAVTTAMNGGTSLCAAATTAVPAAGIRMVPDRQVYDQVLLACGGTIASALMKFVGQPEAAVGSCECAATERE